MDHKTWLWKKKSSEKSIITTDKLDLSMRGNEEEIQILLANKAELENDLKTLNNKLSSALAECNAKDDLVKKHSKTIQEAIIGQKKAEAEAVSLKKELAEVLDQKIADEERLTHLDGALKECMEQLRFVRREQEQRIHDAVVKVSREFEKSRLNLEEQLAESNKRLEKTRAENSQLSKALLAKEKLIDDLNKQMTQAEADLIALMTRLESTEKENASLTYEVRVLQKELEIRNEERDFNHRTADTAHKQHLESVKKITKLESECQRLRLLVRKRLPGPAALAKMKNEVEMLGKESTETRRKKLNSTPSTPLCSLGDRTFDNYPESPSKKIILLTEHLCALEEENKMLKEVLDKKINELHLSRGLYSRAASKLSEVESQLQEFSRGLRIVEPNRNSMMPSEVSLGSVSDIGSDDKVSCAESAASALLSELEYLRSGKHESPSSKTVGALDMSLMDDFVEMEKLAVVSANKPSENLDVSRDEKRATVGSSGRQSSLDSAAMHTELVPTHDHLSDKEIKHRNVLISKSPGWLQDIIHLILEQTNITERDHHEILQEIKVALDEEIKHSNTIELAEAREVNKLDLFKPLPVGLPTDINFSATDKESKQLPADLSLSVCKLVELIEGISFPSADYDNSETLSKKNGGVLPYKNAESPTGYIVRVFQWKTSELGGILQQFLHTCYDVLNQKTDFNKFAQEVHTALDWIMNHCFSLQDVSSMEDAIKKHLNWDDSRSASEADVGTISQFAEVDGLHILRENLSSSPAVALSNGQDKRLPKELEYSNSREENISYQNVNAGAANKDIKMDDRLASGKGEFLENTLQEYQKIISSLQNELKNLRRSKEQIENQVKNHKLINEDLDSQLTAARIELNEAHQQFSALEVEFESKQNYCEELESTCLELQLQHESATKNEIPSIGLKREENHLRSDWEITAASEKLAECQETILNLGKQLKALASPKEAALFDKVVSTPSDVTSEKVVSTPSDVTSDKVVSTIAVADVTSAPATATAPKTTVTVPVPEKKITGQRSLLERMMAEDNATDVGTNSSTPTGSNKNHNPLFIPSQEPVEKTPVVNGNNHDDNSASVDHSLAIVHSKKHGGSLWKKLFSRKKKASSKKLPLPFAP